MDLAVVVGGPGGPAETIEVITGMKVANGRSAADVAKDVRDVLRAEGYEAELRGENNTKLVVTSKTGQRFNTLNITLKRDPASDDRPIPDGYKLALPRRMHGGSKKVEVNGQLLEPTGKPAPPDGM